MEDNVIDLGHFRAKIQTGGKYNPGHCQHHDIVLDLDGGVVECRACGKTVSAFHVLVSFCRNWMAIAVEVKRLKDRAAAMRRLLATWKPRSRAIKALDAYWWRGKTLPCCPHCGQGLLPEDFLDGSRNEVGREFEIARRRRTYREENP